MAQMTKPAERALAALGWSALPLRAVEFYADGARSEFEFETVEDVTAHVVSAIGSIRSGAMIACVGYGSNGAAIVFSGTPPEEPCFEKGSPIAPGALY